MKDSLSNNDVLTNIFKQAPVAIVIFRGENFLIEFANDFYLQILGKSNNIIGQPLFEAFPELKNQVLKEILNNILLTGIPYNINEHEFIVERDKKKEKCFFNCSYQPLRENDNIISGIIVVFSEVTEQINSRKLIEDSEKRFDNMLMKSPFAFAIMKGKNMVVTLANESIKEIWGKGDNLIGKGLFEILPEVIEQGFPKIAKDVFASGIPYYGHEMEVYVQRKGKLEECYFNFVYQPYRELDDKVSGVVIIAYEVTEQVLVKKAIIKSEEKFRLMADLMPVKVSYGDINGITNYFNERWIDYTGLTLDELVSSGWDEIVHPDDKETASKNWQIALKNGTSFEMELRILNKSKKYYWHLNRVKPIKDLKGKILHWIVVNTEIHQQKTQNESLEEDIKDRTQELIIANKNLVQKNIELELSRKELQSEYSRKLIEASQDPLVTINTEGKIMDMNKAMLDVVDKTREELINTDFCLYFTDKEKAEDVYNQVFENGFVNNYPLTMKDGTLTDVLFNGSVYKDLSGNVAGAVVVARDITEQKILEKELTEAKIFAEFATSIAEDAKLSAENAAKIAQDAVKSKQQFLSNMSHEIRTPMNAIIGFTKVVLKTNLTVNQKEYLTAIKMSGDALIVLINDILDLAKVDAGKMTFEKTPFKLNLSIKAMLHLFETKIQEKNLELVTYYDSNIPEVLEGDPVRLHQIILNLVSNAVKFTNKGKITVRVDLISQTETNCFIKFTISDTGIGLDITDKDKIFENFQQASSGTSRIFGGTGLGLAIVKQLVEAQDGTVMVESEIGKGATFSFILNFNKTNIEAVTEPEMVELNTSIKDTKILVAEDMELNQLLMKTLLDDFGFECEIAANGRIAVEKLKTNKYDIVLMDLQMPEMNGFEATEYIRNTLKSSIPIIALTADVTTVDLEKCKSVGMNDYISKPVDERLLYSKLVGIIKKPIMIIEKKVGEGVIIESVRYVDLSYLNTLTKSNPKLMSEMINAYLNQTPPLIKAMNQSFKDKDWNLLQATVHKLLPSFSIMGISSEFSDIAAKIQEYAQTLNLSLELDQMITKLDNACTHACLELELELNKLNN